MYPNLKNPLSIGKIITGLSKSVNIIENFIPLYEKGKPIINDLKSGINKIKRISPQNKKVQTKTTAKSHSLSLNNNPTFFK